MAQFFPPVSAQLLDAASPHLGGASEKDDGLINLELQDGTVYQGYSFGARKSVAGELVFQTGMVGYPEAVTDPSYRGQILVITFPLVGNYGVPSRETVDDLLKDLPAHFESSQIHIAGLVTASYSGEDFSHFLATSSLGTWLREQGIPAMYGVDTRALTKRIREEGSMLGKLLVEKENLTNGSSNGLTNGNGNGTTTISEDRTSTFESIDWVDPNAKNLVADGRSMVILSPNEGLILHSLYSGTQVILTRPHYRIEASIRQAYTCFVPGCWFEIQSIALLTETWGRGFGLPMGL